MIKLVRTTTVSSLASTEYSYTCSSPRGSSAAAAPFTIGRSKGSAMLLKSNTQPMNISRKHAELRCDDGAAGGPVTFSIVDLGSMNGVFLNSVRLAANVRHALRSGDIVVFGGGANIAAGAVVDQMTSEFRFRVSIIQSSSSSESSPSSASSMPPPPKRARGVPPAAPAPPVASASSKKQEMKVTALEEELRASKEAASATAEEARRLAAEQAAKASLLKQELAEAKEAAAKAAQLARLAEASERAREAQAAKLAQLEQELVQTKADARVRDAELAEMRSAAFKDSAKQEDLLSCGVCLDLLVRTLVLSCGHSYCKKCWLEWRCSSDTRGDCPSCPTCRVEISGEPSRSLVLDNNVEHFVNQLDASDERRVAWRERSVKAAAAVREEAAAVQREQAFEAAAATAVAAAEAAAAARANAAKQQRQQQRAPGIGRFFDVVDLT